MKTFIVFLFAFALFFESHAQFFKPLRYNENYGALRDSTRKSWYDQMKFTPLNKSGSDYISFGGEVRYQYFKYQHENWGDSPTDRDGFILSRLLLHADWHTGKHFRVFTQLQSSISVGRAEPPSPVELNEMDLHQLFADYSFVDDRDKSIIFRAGRQEMIYGSSRLVSPREGPNNRQAFDGFKLMLKKNIIKTDLFYTRYVASRVGIFNDKVFNKAVQFAGLYNAVTNVPLVKNVDFYYLWIDRANISWNDVKAKESRHSVGSRVWGHDGKFTYDFEGVFQFGDMAGNTISAWTLSSNTTYALKNTDLAVIAGLKTEAISGDRKANDGKIQSFDPLFPRGAYFGYAAIIGPSNLFDIHPSLSIPLSRVLTVMADYDIFWRYTGHDGIYSPGSTVIYKAGPTTDRFIGHQISGTFEFAPNPFVFFRFETTYFKTGSYLKTVGAGKDIFYMGITTTLRF